MMLLCESLCKKSRTDKQDIIAVVKQDGLALETMPEIIKADREVVIAAVKQDGSVPQSEFPEKPQDSNCIKILHKFSKS